MKFGLVYPNHGSFCDATLASNAVKLAEEYEFDSFMVWDHFLYPRSRKTLDAFLLLSSLVPVTRTIRLGTCVTPILLRGPIITAKLFSTLDLISKGRTILGIGAGWYKREFSIFSNWDKPSVRVDKVSEGLELIHKLWDSDLINFNGRYYNVKNAILEPKPRAKPHPPIWIGSKRNRMVRIAADQADGWIPANLAPQIYDKYVRHISKYRKTKNLNNHFVFAHHSTMMYNYRPCAKHIEDLMEVGCQYCAICIKCDPKKLTENIKKLSKEILPCYSKA